MDNCTRLDFTTFRLERTIGKIFFFSKWLLTLSKRGITSHLEGNPSGDQNILFQGACQLSTLTKINRQPTSIELLSMWMTVTFQKGSVIISGSASFILIYVLLFLFFQELNV